MRGDLPSPGHRKKNPVSSNEYGLYKVTIGKCFPDLVVDSIKLASEGLNDLALAIYDELVFRLPNLDEAVAKIELEATLLCPGC